MDKKTEAIDVLKKRVKFCRQYAGILSSYKLACFNALGTKQCLVELRADLVSRWLMVAQGKMSNEEFELWHDEFKLRFNRKLDVLKSYDIDKNMLKNELELLDEEEKKLGKEMDNFDYTEIPK